LSEIILTKKFQGRNYTYEELILSKNPEEAHFQMQNLAGKFKLHHLTVEDCLHRNQRAKVESFSHYQFIVWYYFHPYLSAPIELHIVIGNDFLLLIANEVPTQIFATWKMVCFQKGQSIILNDAICQLFNSLVDHTELYVQALKNILQLLEKKIISKQINPKNMLRIKFLVLEAEQTICPVPSVFHHLEKHEFNVEQKFQIRNIEDHNTKVVQNINYLRLQAIALMDVYYGSSGARFNQEMRKLTLINAFMLPMSVLTGVFGMNFTNMPFQEVWFMLFGFLLIFATPFLIFLFIVYNKYRKEKIIKKRKLYDKKIQKHYPFLTRKFENSKHFHMLDENSNEEDVK